MGTNRICYVVGNAHSYHSKPHFNVRSFSARGLNSDFFLSLRLYRVWIMLTKGMVYGPSRATVPLGRFIQTLPAKSDTVSLVPFLKIKFSG